jgi:LacI family transcriptional regulator
MAAKSSGETPDTQNSDPPPIRPTLKTIAELTGFAVQTVSRALSDAPDISARTKEQVRKVADDIGYVPNRAGVRLRTGRTNVIALVLPTDNDVLNLTSRLISAIAEGLRDTPYHLVMTPSFSDDDPMKAVRYIVQNGTADAIILNQIQPEDPRVRFLLDRGFPFVTHGRTVWSEEHPFFDYDNNAFARLAVQRLVDHGRRKLLLLAPPLSQNYAIEILTGAREEAAKLGVDLILLDGIDSDSHRSEIRARVAQVLRDDPHLDGLISASPNATMAAIAGLEDAGRSLGDGIDVFSKETVPILDLFRAGILKEPEDVAKAGRFLARAAVQAAARDGSPMLQDLDRPG